MVESPELSLRQLNKTNLDATIVTNLEIWLATVYTPMVITEIMSTMMKNMIKTIQGITNQMLIIM